MTLVGPFHLRIFSDSMILIITRLSSQHAATRQTGNPMSAHCPSHRDSPKFQAPCNGVRSPEEEHPSESKAQELMVTQAGSNVPLQASCLS